MRTESPRVLLPLLLALSALPATAAADERPTLASDGLFVGARLEPGAAFLLGWDLDIYVTGDRFLSLGPAATLAFLGEDGEELGRRQDWLLTLDFLRFKVSLTGGEGAVRPYLFLGGGMAYAWLPAQQTEAREVVLLPDETEAMAVIRYPEAEELAAQVSAGVGLDAYLADNFGLTVAVAAHVRLTEQERLPLSWAEILAGVRFGL